MKPDKTKTIIVPPKGCEVIALNFEISLIDGKLPELVPMLPSGRIVRGRDGREWINDDPLALLASFGDNGADIPVDWNHATELRAADGGESPAAGWITKIEIGADGAVYGYVDWTKRGAETVLNREYRYISPAIVYESESRRIRGFSSVGLVNKPNFRLPALNQQQPATKEIIMINALLLALGLTEDATQEQALNAIAKLQGDLQTALNAAATPSLDRFVPRKDYDLALNRAEAAEGKLKTQAAEQLIIAINAVVDKAIADKKISPASKDYHVACCLAAASVDQFNALVAKSAPIIGDGLDGKDLPEGQGLAVNSDQRKIAAMFGNSAEDLKKYGNA